MVQMFLTIYLNFIWVIVAGKTGAKVLHKYLTVILVTVAGKSGADHSNPMKICDKVHLVVSSRKICDKFHLGLNSRKIWCKVFKPQGNL